MVVKTAPFIVAAKAAGLSEGDLERIMITFYTGTDLPVFLLTVFAKGELRSVQSGAQGPGAAHEGARRPLPGRRRQAWVSGMSKKRAFDKIKAGLEDAIAIARGEADPSTWRIHVPAEVDVKAIRRRLGMTHAEFAQDSGFALDAVQNWEQGRRRPEGAARAFLKVIDRRARGRPPRACGAKNVRPRGCEADNWFLTPFPDTFPQQGSAPRLHAQALDHPQSHRPGSKFP